jgi:hydroxyacylglutathione hydrolase
MTLVFEEIMTQGISQLSYMIGDDSAGVAAVIDPRPDVDVYIDLARKHEVTITHIFETHIHADFMSGSRELADRAGSAKIYASHEGGAESEYGFDHEGVKDGDQFELGKAIIKAAFTPSHTPEHMSYLLMEKGQEDMPWGILSGDCLFVGSAGRPDLLGAQETDKLATDLYKTLYDFYMQLDEDVIVYPCHGAGSACGANIGDRKHSTIGREKRTNAFLQYEGKQEEFKKFVVEGAPPEPDHYSRLKKVNSAGPPILRNLPLIPGLTPKAFYEAVESGQNQLVDTRHMLAFGGGHIQGAISLGARSELSTWAGETLDPEKPILLVLDNDVDLEDIVRLLLRTGFTQYAGYLVGGMTAWDNAGFAVQTLQQMSVHEVEAQKDKLQLLDVRSPGEWKNGHIPGARHQYVAELNDVTSTLDKSKPIVTYCGSGYRASLAASMLQKQGYVDVRNVPGSWKAWTKSNYPVET